MDQPGINSPPRLIKQSNSSSQIKPSKSKVHLPSRYNKEKSIQKTGFHDILNEIETHVRDDQTDKIKQSQPLRLKTKTRQLNLNEYSQSPKGSVFKVKPLKREESDIVNFNQIFLNPREQALKQLQKISKTSDKGKTITKEYQKLLQFQNGYSIDQKIQQSNEINIPKNYQQCIQMLDTQDNFVTNTNNQQQNFFQQHIRMQPPQYPNSSSSSTVSQGSGYAPSIPPNIKTGKQSNVKQLLMRAKAGMNTDDVEKQAHLSYFLGQVYEDKKKYSSSLKFYKRFLGFAKAMQDKIGMCLGSNRVAVNYFKNGDINKSIIFHNQNLKLSDTQNCFTGFYNLGICYRRLNKLTQSLQYFESAFNWAHQKGQQQSQCITLGQIGVTYFKMQLFQQSLQHFQRSLQISKKIKKHSMQLNNLRYILKISAQFCLKPIQVLDEIASSAYECSKNITDNRLQNILRSNLGILRGSIQFTNNKKQLQNYDQVEQID